MSTFKHAIEAAMPEETTTTRPRADTAAGSAAARKARPAKTPIFQRTPRRLVVGITGTTGILYGVRALEVLRQAGIESHLIISRAAEIMGEDETGLSRAQLYGMADVVHPIGEAGAAVASGSFQTMGMLVAPCSARTLAEVANGTTTSLLTRACDVALGQRRHLVLMVRDAPLHSGHLRNMLVAAEMGAAIHPLPATLCAAGIGFVAHAIDHALGRALGCFGIEMPNLQRRGGGTQRPKAWHGHCASLSA